MPQSPGTAETAAGNRQVRAYLDNAATSFPKPREVVEAITASLSSSLTVARSVQRSEFQADEVLRRCRARLAAFINAAAPEEIIYTYSATDSLNIAINGLVPEGAHVLVSPLEHHSVMRPLYHRRRAGSADFSVLPADALGYVDPQAIRSMLRPETSCVIINWVSNVSGTEQPVEAIGEITSGLGIDFLLDASQAAGTHPVDVARLKCTALAMPGHKSLMSIPGTGLLYLRRDREIEPWRIGGTGYRSELLFQPEERPHLYESGTPNVAGIVGLDAAMDWFDRVGLQQVSAHCAAMLARLLEGLARIPGIGLVGPPLDRPRGFVLSFSTGSIDPLVFSSVLAEQFGITTRPGLHCAPSAHEHFGTYEAGGTVRLSVSYFTTETEVDYCLDAVSETAEGFGIRSTA